MSRSALIIGQGLAGTVLACVLESRGWKTEIIDDGHVHASSLVAAGMWNPVSFRNLHTTWLFETLVRDAEQVYRSIESVMGIRVYHPLELVRIFGSFGEANTWVERSDNPALRPFLSEERLSGAESFAHAPFGCGVVKGAGWVDLSTLLRTYRDQCVKNGTLHVEVFDEKRLTFSEANVKYGPIEADIIILCTGWRNNEISLFNWLPIRPNKGQVLNVEIDGPGPDRILNFGHFLLPVGNGKYRLGATYEHSPKDLQPTGQARELLEQSLNAVSTMPAAKVSRHLAGIRPTVPDRKPLIGPLPDNPRLFVFNGFGSKGVMYCPHFALHFAEYLEGRAELNPEVNISRYYPTS